MPLRASVALYVIASLGAGVAEACIIPSPAERVAQVALDRQRQEALVSQVAEEADTIVIARATSSLDRGLRSEFRILQVVKGGAAVGKSQELQASPSIPPIACTTPSETFRNTATLRGRTYLLYVRGNRLLRARDSERTQEDISEARELELIAKASNKSLERSRER